MNKRVGSLLICIAMTVVCLGNAFTGALSAYAIEDNRLEVRAKIEGTNEEGAVTTGTQESAREAEGSELTEESSSSAEEEIAQIEEVDISSAEDMIVFARNCRLDSWSKNKYVKLTDDITMVNFDFEGIPSFSGTFDGNGHTVSGVNISASLSKAGLFSQTTRTAVIKNLNVQGRVTPVGTRSVVGGIVGKNHGVIYNCTFTGLVSATDYVGGIVGINELDGIIADSSSYGYVFGKHFTGGIAGENMGNIYRCSNDAEINTSEQDNKLSLDDFDVNSYLKLIKSNKSNSESDSASMINGIVDMGGIAGVSIGVIRNCKNNATIGYEKIGYNVGGIAGRQSGYMYDCTNYGKVLGRKDVGGIVGQAEPYVTIDFTQDIAYQLSENISKLHDIISVTLNDASGQSDIISNRLAVIQQFTSEALKDTDYISTSTEDFINGVVEATNEALDRVDYVVSELGKDGGVFDHSGSVIDNLTTMGSRISDSIKGLDVYGYLSEDQKAQYKGYESNIKEANDYYKDSLKKASNAFKQFYIDTIRSLEDEYNKDDDANEKNLYPVKDGEVVKDWNYDYVDAYRATDDETEKDQDDGYINIFRATDEEIAKTDAAKQEIDESFGVDPGDISEDKLKEIYEKYKDIDSWTNVDENGNPIGFPTDAETAQGILNDKLMKEVTDKYGKEILELSEKYAEYMFYEKYGETYAQIISDASNGITDMIMSVYEQMSDNEKKNADGAVSALKSASSDMKSVVSETKSIFSNLSNRGDIALPTLSEDYKSHTKSLNNNLMGMSDNFGYLNSEMNGASDTMIKNLMAVSDQFNIIMQLYTDAIDGVLDKDYSSVIEDDSVSVASTCTDATIADCVNKGTVEGSIDVAGIVGTMAIEYDFDLESDITGIKDSTLNNTYRTKCVQRQNINNGNVIAEKSYTAGICGLQEMGTILKCENYAKIVSNSGNYVGGIAGESISDIVSSYEKGILSGKEYVGGIAGLCNNISDSYAIVKIEDADAYYGAIAGDSVVDATLKNNYFVSEDLVGIDRVSYQSKAEPLSYKEMMELEDVPKRFGKMTITFIVEDDDVADEDKTVGSLEADYGSLVMVKDFPKVNQKENYYVDWNQKEDFVITSDVEISAAYTHYITTIASDIVRISKQSALLVDGNFREDDVLTAELDSSSTDRLDKAMEYWNISIPEDGNDSHQIRYVVDDEYREKIGGQFGVYYYKDGSWEKISQIGQMGSYYTFEVPGNEVKLQIVNEYSGINKTLVMYICIGIIVIVLLVIFIIIVRRNNRKKMVHKTNNNS